MSSTLTSVTSMPACSARVASSASLSPASASDSVLIATWSPLTICTSAPSRPASASVAWMSATVTSPVRGYWILAPPSKSIE
jgi:hypothetical protein